MHVIAPTSVGMIALRGLRYKARYQAVYEFCGVPIAVIAALHYRESNFDFATGLGQGDPIDAPSVHVPKGHGPFVTWEDAANFYLHFDHMDDNSQPWSLPYACFKTEAWNGFGPRNHGRTSGYLWSGTDQYTGGKYVADGVWNPDVKDVQLGVIPIIKEMISLDRSLAFGGPTNGVDDASLPPTLTPTPAAVGTDEFTTIAIQRSLNARGYGPLAEDGNYGRKTREAVRAFQAKNNLVADGLIGPKTRAALFPAI